MNLSIVMTFCCRCIHRLHGIHSKLSINKSIAYIYTTTS
nr:MAG TPA: hypothetical protein [Caudoviricetes sp.]